MNSIYLVDRRDASDSAHRREYRLRFLKRLIWIYFALLIFEGAFRKWILPDFATPLLLIRDPVAFLIIIEGIKRGLLPRSPSFYISITVGVIGVSLALVVGHGSLFVAAYGARPFLLHFPAMFIVALALDRADIILAGKYLLVASLAMTLLLALQFFSPSTAWVNLGVGGEGSSGFSGALGFDRPAGTFSFTNGVTHFYSLCAAFLLYFWIHGHHIQRWLLYGATACLILAIPLSISRALFLQILIAIGFCGVVIVAKPKLLAQGVKAAAVLIVLLVILTQTPFFEIAMSAMQARFERANESEGGMESVLLDRYLGGFLRAILASDEQPFFGYGIGMGTNAGSVLLIGESQFLISEGEWGRLLGELGPILGMTAILMRVGVTAIAGIKSMKKLRQNDILPWMLLGNAVLILPQGQWGQPTALGFSIVAGSLLLASLRRK